MVRKEGNARKWALAPLLAGGAAVAALAGMNRYIDGQVGPLPEQLPVAPREHETRFGWMVYYAAGSEDAPPLLLIHGHNAAASAYEWRKQFWPLADRYRVFAPDLLGYGLSDRPALEYTA